MYKSSSINNKTSELLRHGIKLANWIEIGTFVGDTTKFLSKNYKRVFTIEASEECLKKTKKTSW
tara:strand:+ start:2006 stop:2197 length:192 start_codon:yes stop_codon:yes gene_type:complete